MDVITRRLDKLDDEVRDINEKIDILYGVKREETDEDEKQDLAERIKELKLEKKGLNERRAVLESKLQQSVCPRLAAKNSMTWFCDDQSREKSL